MYYVGVVEAIQQSPKCYVRNVNLMDDGYKSKLKAAIVASEKFQGGLHHPNPPDSCGDNEMREAINNLSYAVLDFVIAALGSEEISKRPFEQVRIVTQATFHRMMSISMSCVL